jgi:hypothetical protein
MGFRIAGRCDCRTPYRSSIEEHVCKTIHETLASWRSRLPDDIAAVPTESFEELSVDGHHVTLGTLKRQVSTGRSLVVCQALVHTWWRAKFFSIGAVGRIYAEGLLVTDDGSVEPASDDLMWQFR